MKIIINDDWYIESDDLCYIVHDTHLKEWTRNGETRLTRGDHKTYYMKIEDALCSIAEKSRLHNTSDLEGTLDDYIEKIFNINKETESNIKSAQIIKKIKEERKCE